MGRPPYGSGFSRPDSQARPFTPRPPVLAAPPETSSIRLRDGDREVEVHGTSAFCRQIIDELPLLLDRLRTAPGTAASIALPSPPSSRGPRGDRLPEVSRGDGAHATAPDGGGAHAAPPDPGAAHPTVLDEIRSRRRSRTGAGNGRHAPSPDHGAVSAPTQTPADPLDEQVLTVLRASGRPLAVAEIRAKLGDELSGQAVRRILERAHDLVVSVGGKPAAYRAR